jgi:hypothetical protein
MQAYREALPNNTTMVLAPDSEFFRFFRSMLGVDSTPAGPAPGPAAAR